MDLERLKTLVALAEEGSMAAAARTLGVGQNTLRKRISELEAEVGVALVERAGRRLVSTRAGAVLVRGGRELLARSRSLIDRVQSDSTGVVGEYRVAIPIGMPLQVNAMAIAGHRAQFPGLRLRVLPVARPIELLPHEADIAVTFEPRPDDGPWLSAVVRRMPELVLASRPYLERHGTPRSVDELGEHVLMSWSPPGEDPAEWPLRAGGHVTVRTALTSADILMLRRCMLSGMGLARLPDGGLPDIGVPAGTVVPVLPETLGRELAVRVVVPDAPQMRGLFRHYLAFIRAQEERLGRD